MKLRVIVASIASAASVLVILPATALASGSPLGPPAAPTTAPFQQCAAVYLDPSCGYLIDVTNSGNKVLVDPSIGYYEGQDDVLVGIQNDSSNPISSIHVGVAGSGFGSFGFDGDGLCTPGGGPVPADCPFGPAGDPGDYFGPDAQLTPDSSSSDSGTVTFPTPLQPGQYTYFSLESPFSGATVVAGNTNDVIQTNLSDGSNSGARLSEPSPTDVTDTATIAPAQSSDATGNITFTVYSDPACTSVAAGPFTVALSSNQATSPAFGASLATNAIYYVQATYAGDSNYNAVSTNCGDETLTFGTPPSKAQATIATSLVGSNGANGAQITVPTGTAVHDTAAVTSGGQPASGRVTYYVFSDSACTTQVPGVNLGSGVASNGSYPPSATVTLPNGTYYFQVIYSGNSTLAGGRSPCTEVLTVEPPCNCTKISSYLSSFHVFGAGSTRLEFNFHSAVTCSVGAGGCAGSITMIAPGRAKFIDSSKARNGGVGLKLRRSVATLPFSCAGPCAVRTTQPTYTLQWLAFKRIKIKIRRHGKVVKVIRKTIPDPAFTPQGRARTTRTVKLVEVCNGVRTTVKLRIHFDKHGQVSYKKSDVNGDGTPDGGRLTDLTGFL
jgi:hypothetical protein